MDCGICVHYYYYYASNATHTLVSLSTHRLSDSDSDLRTISLSMVHGYIYHIPYYYITSYSISHIYHISIQADIIITILILWRYGYGYYGGGMCITQYHAVRYMFMWSVLVRCTLHAVTAVAVAVVLFLPPIDIRIIMAGAAGTNPLYVPAPGRTCRGWGPRADQRRLGYDHMTTPPTTACT